MLESVFHSLKSSLSFAFAWLIPVAISLTSRMVMKKGIIWRKASGDQKKQKVM